MDGDALPIVSDRPPDVATFGDPEYGYGVVIVGGGEASSTTWSSGNATNRSTEELLESYMGARYRNMAECVVLTIVYAAIFFTGLIGNVCTCVVITKNAYMHTATNYYLFSLAISDVMTLILGKNDAFPISRHCRKILPLMPVRIVINSI